MHQPSHVWQFIACIAMAIFLLGMDKAPPLKKITLHGGYVKCDRDIAENYTAPRRPHIMTIDYPEDWHFHSYSSIAVDFEYCVGEEGESHSFDFEYKVVPDDYPGDVPVYLRAVEAGYKKYRHVPAKVGGAAFEICGCRETLTFEP